MTRLFSEALLNIRHGGAASVLAVLIVALTAALFSALYLIRNALYAEVAQFEENAGAAVFLEDSLSKEQVEQLEARIQTMRAVQKTHIVWKEEALQRSRELFGKETDLLLQGFEEIPLPVAIEVFANEESRTAASMRALVQSLRQLNGVEDVVFENESMEQVDRMKRIAFLIGGLIAAVSMVVIAFSIMLTVYARREELAILRLLGATYAFVRIPLLLQGLLVGLIGSALGLAALYGLFWQYGASIGVAAFLKPGQMVVVVAGAALIGTAAGMAPLRKHIRSVH